MSDSKIGPEVDPLRRVAFQQLRSGEFDAAIAFFDRQVIDDPVTASWNELGDALLCAGELAKAEDAYRRPREIPSPHGYVTMSVGAALWLQGKHAEACNDWHDELDRVMSTTLKRYNASGIFLCALLWWAYRRSGEPENWDALQAKLKQVLKTRGQQEVWGLTIMNYILDGVTSTQFLEIAPDAYQVGNIGPTDRGALQQLSQAHFYIAGKYEVNSPGWTESLRACVHKGNPAALSFPEYRIAKYELGCIAPAGSQ